MFCKPDPQGRVSGKTPCASYNAPRHLGTPYSHCMGQKTVPPALCAPFHQCSHHIIFRAKLHRSLRLPTHDWAARNSPPHIAFQIPRSRLTHSNCLRMIARIFFFVRFLNFASERYSLLSTLMYSFVSIRKSDARRLRKLTRTVALTGGS